MTDTLVSSVYSADKDLKSSLFSSSKLKYLIASVIIVLCFCAYNAYSYFNRTPTPKLDQEMYDERGKILNPSTQSINRYSSVLRTFSNPVNIRQQDKKLSFILSNERNDQINLNGIDFRFLLPMLPYPMDGFSDFDRANLMLAEFSRNAVSLSYQENNDLIGFFNASENVFNAEDEYLGSSEGINPNPQVKPLRFSVTNNCLGSGLWELSAVDSVGEIYHSWFDMPRSVYYGMIKELNALNLSDLEMFNSLRYRTDLSDVSVDLDSLRTEGALLVDVAPRINPAKEVGGYSTQDSRRKVQNKYFEVMRGNNVIQTPESFYDLALGDTFKLRKFVPPGVYSADEKIYIPFNPFWNRVEIKEVAPLTQYQGGRTADDPLGYIEITMHNKNDETAVVVGNLPVSLLVEQQDYFVPAFGVGVLMPSERIERRYFRLNEGPVPHYAYMMSKDNDGWKLINNHEVGIEQITVRPIKKQGKTFLRINLIAYERILDLIEMEVPISEELAARIDLATHNYTPPLYRVYRDDNII